MTFKQTSLFRSHVDSAVKFGKENQYMIHADGSRFCDEYRAHWTEGLLKMGNSQKDIDSIFAKANQVLKAKVF